jgi:hypothetical protein
MPKPTILAHDTFVQQRSPVVAAVGCLITGGILGAVHQHRTSSVLSRYGRARGRMPFPFIQMNPGVATTWWIVGLLAWYLLVAAVISYVVELGDGYSPSAADVTTFAAFVLLLAPLWLIATTTIRHVRTAQHLAGVEGPWPSPFRGALVVAAFPPLGTWYVQRQLNRIWQAYE